MAAPWRSPSGNGPACRWPSSIDSYFFLQEIGLIGKPATFWIYAFIGLLATGFIWLRVPENRGRSLEQIEQEVHGRPEQAA